MDRELEEILPSKRSEIEQKKQHDAMVRAQQQAGMMREDFMRTFKSAHGRRVLAWIMERTGYEKYNLAADSRNGIIDPMMTTFNAMERNLAIAIRQHLTPELLQEIDYGRTKPSGHPDYARKPVERVSRPKRNTGTTK